MLYWKVQGPALENLVNLQHMLPAELSLSFRHYKL